MDCNPIVGFVFFHCVFVLTEMFIQSSAGITDVGTITISASEFIDLSECRIHSRFGSEVPLHHRVRVGLDYLSQVIDLI